MSLLPFCKKGVASITLQLVLGIVRGIDNLGDRIITKTLKGQDGNKYGMVRYIQLEFNGSPQTLKIAQHQAYMNTETLQVFHHKIKDQQYLKRTLKRLNTELSPLKDEETKDANLVRNMWTQYVRNSNFQRYTNDNEVRREQENVHAFLKKMEVGEDHEDAQTVAKVATGQMDKDDIKMRNYLIKRYQKKRYS
ncbi:UNKNOWN [Stylonychia lemnae]|uniref:Uncharacterized protein n=1 Tax=Stylonychia lemnae TaxID=5949 RepID=A0A078BC31_STYLE|nr:UNKNOWN [Stylonychia lemnae]|eukprot:CDW91766.1 UNKNOWN [Stylonychia lemnae]